jgi:transcriptional regulator with XRE-family HTH domain
MKKEELLKSEGYWTSKIQIDLYHNLLRYMEINKLNQTQFAKKLGVSKGYISQILNGDFNFTINKLVELSLAMEKIPEFSFIDLNQAIQDANEGYKSIPWIVSIKIPSANKESLNDNTEVLPIAI